MKQAAHDDIRRDVERLAPWYYLWDFGGVRTDAFPPCDDQGFRQVFCPPIAEGFWTGKSVLDVACNEGAYGIGALTLGADRLVGFDCRERNVEKARFAAAFQGRAADTSFEVGTCDDWVADHPDASFDVVMMCGILYHLRDPERTIADYAARAREWVFVTCCVIGDDAPGYTWTSESESDAASDGALDSLMPNNARTLIDAFASHGFVPWHVEEVRKAEFWDGATLLLRRHDAGLATIEPATGTGADGVDVHASLVAADDPTTPTLYVAAYNRRPAPRTVTVDLAWRDAAGATTSIATERIALAARAMTPADHPSRAVQRQLPVARPADAVELVVTARDDDGVCGHRVLRLAAPAS